MNPFNKDPPPVKTAPFSIISADNSGGVSSNTLLHAETILLILFFAGIQIILIGIMGEYLGRIFNESKNRA